MELISVPTAVFVAAVVLLTRMPLPVQGRRALLLAANALFLGLFDPLAPVVFLVTSLVGYGAAVLAARGAGGLVTTLTAAPLLVPLFLPKLGVMADATGNAANVVGSRVALFVGASYFALRALHVVLDARRTKKLAFGLFDFLVYNSFFPTVVAGPIERADHLAKTWDRLGQATGDDLRAAAVRIFQGLFKRIVLGNLALAWAAPITGFDPAESMGELTWYRAWVALYAMALYAYFDFAGYSDLAIGVARLMGLRLAENFDNPYLRTSIAEFWRGWHLSLSFWIRDYLFLPMCGRSRSVIRPHVAALASMTLCGLWHAPTIGWLAWGFCHGAGLSVHQAWTTWLRKRFKLKKKLAASPAFRIAATVLTFHFVALTWVLVSIDPTRLRPSWDYFLVLIGLA